MNSRDGLKTMLIAGAVLIVPIAFYCIAYFACTTGMGTVQATGGSCRVYPYSWQAMIFFPASLVESAATGRKVTTAFTVATAFTSPTPAPGLPPPP